MGEKAIITERKESRLHEPMAGFLIRIFSRIGPIDPYNMHIARSCFGMDSMEFRRRVFWHSEYRRFGFCYLQTTWGDVAKMAETIKKPDFDRLFTQYAELNKEFLSLQAFVGEASEYASKCAERKLVCSEKAEAARKAKRHDELTVEYNALNGRARSKHLSINDMLSISKEYEELSDEYGRLSPLLDSDAKSKTCLAKKDKFAKTAKNFGKPSALSGVARIIQFGFVAGYLYILLGTDIFRAILSMENLPVGYMFLGFIPLSGHEFLLFMQLLIPFGICTLAIACVGLLFRVLLTHAKNTGKALIFLMIAVNSISFVMLDGDFYREIVTNLSQLAMIFAYVTIAGLLASIPAFVLMRINAQKSAISAVALLLCGCVGIAFGGHSKGWFNEFGVLRMPEKSPILATEEPIQTEQPPMNSTKAPTEVTVVGTYYKVLPEGLNLRNTAGASTADTVVAVLKKGDVLLYLGETTVAKEKEWIKVEFEGQIGWVSKGYIEILPPSNMASSGTIDSPYESEYLAKLTSHLFADRLETFELDRYLLYDINKDSVPEFIGDYGGSNVTALFAINNGEIYELFLSWAHETLYRITDTGYIITQGGEGGWWGYIVYGFDGSNISLEAIESIQGDEDARLTEYGNDVMEYLAWKEVTR